MKETTILNMAVSELDGLPLNEEERKLTISELGSIFLGEDDFRGSFEFFLNFRVIEV